MRVAIAMAMTGMILWTGAAQAVELNYRWKKGEVHRFQYEDDSRISMETGGMAGLDMRMKVQSRFSMKVLKKLPGGKAEVEMTVKKLDLFQGGRRLASISKIPPAARKVKAVIDRKGRVKFYKMESVYVQDDQIYVGIHKLQAGPYSASASASIGDETVDVVASVDPETGQVTAAMTVRKRPAKLKKVTIRQEDPAIDVLPKGLFEMMVLPDGSMRAGSTQKIKLPFVTMVVTLEKMNKKIAVLRTRSEVAVDSKNAGQTATGGMGMAMEMDTDDDDHDDEDDDAMGAMPSMGGMGNMPGMPDMGKMMAGAGAPGGGGDALSAKTEMTADVTTRFDTGAGKLLGMQGSIVTEMNAGGLAKVKMESRFSLKRI